MKRRIAGIICVLFLYLCSMTALPVSADETTAATETIETVQNENEEEGYSKGVKIAGFLGIFTVAMGVTAFIVVKPKLKMLKEIKNKTEK